MKKNINKKKQKSKEQKSLEIENDLINFKLSIDKKDKTKEYIRFCYS